ncbi:Hypothetical protein CINCED_3A023340 [Cinara cedri]|uniref:Uncharacterized protein n=1 Tax=Cinara cedri TaxID=506608 RepID=A0A5E4NJ68_9HEMI|nr:Hypothetical protein CINCED_3A023340 [Cinara cedri]
MAAAVLLSFGLSRFIIDDGRTPPPGKKNRRGLWISGSFACRFPTYKHAYTRTHRHTHARIQTTTTTCGLRKNKMKTGFTYTHDAYRAHRTPQNPFLDIPIRRPMDCTHGTTMSRRRTLTSHIIIIIILSSRIRFYIDRLNGLALMSIHRDIPLNVDAIIDEMALSPSRLDFVL